MGYKELEENVLLNDFKWVMKRFGVSDNVCAISSLNSAALDGGDKAIVSGVIGVIAITSDNILSPRETGV